MSVAYRAFIYALLIETGASMTAVANNLDTRHDSGYGLLKWKPVKNEEKMLE